MKEKRKKISQKNTKGHMASQTINHLKNEKYITIGTSDWRGNPHVSTKILFKIEPSVIYAADNVAARTCKNIEHNHRVALSIINNEEQLSYCIYGTAKLLAEGREYKNLIGVLETMKVQYATSRVVEGVRRGKKHKKFDLVSAPPKVIIKIKVKKVMKMNLFGNTENKNL